MQRMDNRALPTVAEMQVMPLGLDLVALQRRIGLIAWREVQLRAMQLKGTEKKANETDS